MAMVQINAVRKVNKGNVLGSVDLEIGMVRVFGVLIAKTKAKNTIVVWPSRSYETRDGERRYQPIVKPKADVLDKVNSEILAYWEKNKEDLEVPF